MARIAETEWGVLCDVVYDQAGAGGRPIRRVHAADELVPAPDPSS